MQPPYPDISDILAAKAQRRQALAALSWEEKVAIVERMRRLQSKGSWKEKKIDEKNPDRIEYNKGSSRNKVCNSPEAIVERDKE